VLKYAVVLQMLAVCITELYYVCSASISDNPLYSMLAARRHKATNQ